MWVNVKHKVCVYRQAFGSIFTYFWEMCVCVCGCACVFVCVRGLARQRMECTWEVSGVADGGILDTSRGRGPYYCDWRATVKGSRGDLFKSPPGNN